MGNTLGNIINPAGAIGAVPSGSGAADTANNIFNPASNVSGGINSAANNENSDPVSYVGENTGVPTVPGYVSSLQAEQQNLANIPQVNTQPLNQLQNYANSGSNNQWVQAQLAAQQQAQGQAMGAAKQNASSAGASAEDQAAIHGGLNSGAQQNIANTTANNATMAGQNVIGQGLQQQGAIQSQNAQNELGVLSNLPGQEVQAVQPAIQEAALGQQAIASNNSGLNQFNMTGYQNQIAQQAGQEEAQATANGGKK
jgi:hypothetical protein